jgi:hypothetical protein
LHEYAKNPQVQQAARGPPARGKTPVKMRRSRYRAEAYHLCGAFFRANTAGGAFTVIHPGYPVIHNYTLFRTIFNTKLAFNTASFAGFDHHGLYRIAVGTTRHSPFLVLRRFQQQLLRALGGAEFAAGTLFPVDSGKAVFPHGKRAEFADRRAVAKAKAAPGAELGTPGGKLRPPAAWNPRILALEGRVFPGSLAREYHYYRFYSLRIRTQEGGNFFRHSLAADGTAAGTRLPRGYRPGVTVTAGKTAGAAIGAGKRFPDQGRKGVLFNGEKFPEKAQGNAQNQRKQRGKNSGN